eukprot:CAMPEP_0177793852 /NCGR_PEP_ID=MMETSP0491_2-20121128/25312_1 /TAXON_ID=63592 /ORGANISM="Tetraselmis chuii, Strain PLY429" /LENGTH=145 /DNA_ID=CAMNT_0019316427 /DNA_START=597 /DNA_END=1035 /DNA_ORIENTATION=+
MSGDLVGLSSPLLAPTLGASLRPREVNTQRWCRSHRPPKKLLFSDIAGWCLEGRGTPEDYPQAYCSHDRSPSPPFSQGGRPFARAYAPAPLSAAHQAAARCWYTENTGNLIGDGKLAVTLRSDMGPPVRPLVRPRDEQRMLHMAV